MADLEIESFVRKFKLLWNAGFTASLNIESALGEVNISLNCKVGRTKPPPMPFMSPVLLPNMNRSPSYYRRQVRRKTTRESLSTMSCGTNTPCRDENSTDNHNESCKKAEVSAAEKSTEVDVLEETPCEESTEKVDFELHKDKIITEVIVHAVSEPTEKKEDVEEEIKKKFADIGVRVERIRSFCNHEGNFETARVTTTPVNLKDIGGRCLGMKNCAIRAFENTP